MKARQPKIDFKDVSPHWSPEPEFAQNLNAGSISAPHVEAYLNLILGRAAEELGPEHSALREDVKVFIDQETTHLRLHSQFNRRMYDSGYRFVRDFELRLKDDLRRFAETKSMKFNLAYSAGFECFSHFLARYLYEGVPDIMAKSDPRMRDLWLWHAAEEYEHRSTCHDVYVTLYGGYFYRVYVLVFSFIHLMGMSAKINKSLLKADREKMTPAERRESLAREKKIKRLNARFFWPHVFHLFSPGYNPRQERPARGVEQVLASYA